MIDRPFGDYGKARRAPDLRVDGVHTGIFSGIAPFDYRSAQTDRGTLVYLLKGDFRLTIEGKPPSAREFTEGTAFGFEDGRAHHWRSLNTPGAPVEILVSSIPLRMSVLRKLDERYMVVPPHAEPHATVLRLAVELHRHEYLSANTQDNGVIRRCAEICLIQFIDYARKAIAAVPNAPPGLAHDERLLRAWIAYLRDPGRKWTVAALADAAGLGRTAFAQRFRAVFGTPPVQALTDLRLDQAMDMLRHTQAPLIEIAFTSGYNSEAAFVRAFHRKYGLPPGRFRAISSGEGAARQVNGGT